MEQNTSYKSLKNKGFTLVEIVVVIAIMIVLLAVLTPSLLRYVENSRMQRDESAVDEVVHTIHLAMSDPATFDEVYSYSIPNNYTTYTDSSAVYGSKYTDEEFWAPDGSGRTVTITFNPDANGDYNIAEGIVNNMTLGNGSLSDERALDATKQCTLATMGNKELYTAINKTIGPILEEASATYQNSSYTVFIEFNTLGAQRRVDVYGEWNGTNLSTSSNVSNSSGTSTVPPEEEEEVNTPAPPTQPNIPPVDLGGSGGTTSGGGGTYQPTQPTQPAPHSHDYTILNTPATCTKEGLETKTCSCGDVQTSTIPALGHTEIPEPEVAATCTQGGSTRGTRCSVCNTVIERQTPTSALGHAYEVTQTTAPTCVTTGLKTFTCSRCGTSYTETIEIIAHQDNNNDFFCDTCNKNLCEHTQVVIPPVSPTCITTGLTEGLKCDKCNTIITPQETIPALGHIDTDNNGYCDRCEPVPQNKYNVTLVYRDEVTANQIVKASNKTELPTPSREGYRFDDWYVYTDSVGSKEITTFTNPNSTYPWTKDASGIWSSGNKAVKSTTSNMLSEAFKLETSGSVSFQWRSNGESNYDYLGYDILNVTTGKYLSGKTSPTYSSCLATLKGKASTSYTTVTYNLSAGTYKILFMYGKDSSVDREEDKGFVKNITVNGVRSTALGTIIPSIITEDLTVGANWIGNNYTIIYNGNGADSGSTANSTHTYGTKSQLRENGFIKAEHVFVGWNTKVDGSGTTYRDKETILNLSSTHGANITLYAQWVKSYGPNVLIFKTDNIAYLYDNDGLLYKTYTGWHTTTYSFMAGRIVEPPWFKDKELIRTIIVEDGVKFKSMNYIFSRLPNLSKVVLGNSITRFGDSTFDSSTSLTSIGLIGSGASIELSERITGLGEGCFWGCTGLTSVRLPSSLTVLETDAFRGCSGLTSVGPEGSGADFEIPSSVKRLSYRTGTRAGGTFMGCTGLRNVVLPNTITDIGGDTFAYCDNLVKAIIPSSITTLGDNTFYECDGIVSVGAIGSGASVELDTGVKSLGEYTFEKCRNLKTVRIPNTVTDMGTRAFYYCTGITSVGPAGGGYDVEIPTSIPNLGKYTFEDCTNLKKVVVPSHLTSLGTGAFYQCTGLTSVGAIGSNSSVEIPTSVTNLGTYTFYDCPNITKIVINEGVTSLGEYLFDGCDGITSVGVVGSNADLQIPRSLKTIGNAVFQSCANLTTVNLGNNVTNIGQRAFYACRKLTNVTIPSTVTTIQSETFWDCTALTNIVIPRNITTIKNGAFKNSGLTTITIPNSVTLLEGSVFYNCKNLTSVTIGSGVKRVYANLFQGCTSLTNIVFVDTTTWYYTTSSSATSGGTQYDVTDPSAIAQFILSNTSYHWYKT